MNYNPNAIELLEDYATKKVLPETVFEIKYDYHTEIYDVTAKIEVKPFKYTGQYRHTKRLEAKYRAAVNLCETLGIEKFISQDLYLFMEDPHIEEWEELLVKCDRYLLRKPKLFSDRNGRFSIKLKDCDFTTDITSLRAACLHALRYITEKNIVFPRAVHKIVRSSEGIPSMVEVEDRHWLCLVKAQEPNTINYTCSSLLRVRPFDISKRRNECARYRNNNLFNDLNLRVDNHEMSRTSFSNN